MQINSLRSFDSVIEKNDKSKFSKKDQRKKTENFDGNKKKNNDSSFSSNKEENNKIMTVEDLKEKNTNNQKDIKETNENININVKINFFFKLFRIHLKYQRVFLKYSLTKMIMKNQI